MQVTPQPLYSKTNKHTPQKCHIIRLLKKYINFHTTLKFVVKIKVNREKTT